METYCSLEQERYLHMRKRQERFERSSPGTRQLIIRPGSCYPGLCMRGVFLL
jgi:hypothetical protein